jgi:hypothetical protein
MQIVRPTESTTISAAEKLMSVTFIADRASADADVLANQDLRSISQLMQSALPLGGGQL